MIIEDLMLDLMYTLPGQKKIRECVITREVVQSKEKPITLIEKAGLASSFQLPAASLSQQSRSSTRRLPRARKLDSW